MGCCRLNGDGEVGVNGDAALEVSSGFSFAAVAPFGYQEIYDPESIATPAVASPSSSLYR